MDASTIDKHTRNIHLTTLIRPFSNKKTDEIPKGNVQIGKAFFDYTANQSDEVSVRKGSVVQVLNKKSERGWVHAKIGDQEGLIPKNYVRLIGKQLKEISGEKITKGKSIGLGAYSVVYQGLYNGKQVALKIPNNLQDKTASEIREILNEEALIYARLSHKNIVEFYGICIDPPHCLVLELCYGDTLSEMLCKLSYADPICVLNWAIQIAKGMEHLHKRDDALVHADLKADNVLIKEKPCFCKHLNNKIDIRSHSKRSFKTHCYKCGCTNLDKLTLKLTDFNISRAESEKRTTFEGSVAWMAPEVIRGGQHTKQSDVYSFGLIVWQMLTKETPFADIPCLSTMYLIGNNKTPLIPEDCPVYFRNIMQSCWNTDPEKRPCFTDLIKTMKQIRNDIKKKYTSTTRLNYIDSNKLTIHNYETIEQLKQGSKSIYVPKTLYYESNYQPAPEIPNRGKNTKDCNRKTSKVSKNPASVNNNDQSEIYISCQLINLHPVKCSKSTNKSQTESCTGVSQNRYKSILNRKIIRVLQPSINTHGSRVPTCTNNN